MFPRIVELTEQTAEYVFADNNPVMFIYMNNDSALTE